MMLGKRARPPVKRTTSMTEFTLDFSQNPPPSSDPHNPFIINGYSAAAAARPPRRNSADYAQTDDHFLRVCSLCKRRLIPDRDIYMYRGDSAFCSLECRQQQMAQDDRKEKCAVPSAAAAAGGA